MSSNTRRLIAVASLALVLAVSAFAAACGESGGAPGATGPSDGSISHPVGATDIVLQVSSAGGFVPVEWALTQVPEFTLYGDGTVIVTGPIDLIYPGPALPNLQTTTVSEDTVQAILVAAREAGLFSSGVDYGQPGITDMNTATITVNAEGKTYRSDIYALGMEQGAGGLTMQQQQARAAVAALTGKLQNLGVFQNGEPVWAPYQYSALAVFSVAVNPDVTPEVEPNRLQWPLADLATLGTAVAPEGYRKAIVSGDDLSSLQPLLAQANQGTVWTFGDHEYNLYFRPLLPGETE